MTSQSKPYPLISELIGVFDDWRKRRRSLREVEDMRQCDGEELGRIAKEFGATPDELDALVRQGSRSARQLPELLKSLDIDEQAVAHIPMRVLGDMQRVCAACQAKRRCDRELAAGTSAEHYEEYCNNAATIDALGQALRSH